MPANEHKSILFDFLIQPRFRVWRHLFVLVAFSFVSIGQSLFVFENQAETLGNGVYWFGIGNTVAMITLFYLNLYFLVPRLLLNNKYIEYFILLLAQVSLYMLLKGVVEFYMLSHVGIVRNFNAVSLLDGLSNLTLYAICIASCSATTFFKQWIADTERINKLENNQLSNSVDEIKSHINPKSLSNVLRYMSEKVKTDPDEASDILFRLSDVLRYELYDCKREKVLLESDIEFIDKYLSLEQLNGQNRFSYTISTTGNVNLFVPPFFFMPVIQKIIEQQPADMQISFDIHTDSVLFECKASGANPATDVAPVKLQLSV